MRKEIIVKLDDKEIKILELRNKDLMVLIEKYGDLLQNGITIKDLPKLAKEIIPNCTSLSLPEFDDMPVRLTKEIYEKFEEINKDFFQILLPKKSEEIPKSILASKTA